MRCARKILRFAQRYVIVVYLNKKTTWEPKFLRKQCIFGLCFIVYVLDSATRLRYSSLINGPACTSQASSSAYHNNIVSRTRTTNILIKFTTSAQNTTIRANHSLDKASEN
ncbi:hypothetical protein PUN28_003315 [Cardiocondyla obscurior]|uniref:Uncharacterized protein n=1 Tax=Cardiocondyla obscurior TaxID=286306 RepID=A0AAW2GK78_9HYME